MAHGPDTDNLLRHIAETTRDSLYLGPNTEHDLNITSLPTLPDSLKLLHINALNIRSLPTLPSALEDLRIVASPVTSLPSLPSNLLYLYSTITQLTELPQLPPRLLSLGCIFNIGITELTQLPSSLKRLCCGWTSIIKLPQLPDSLEVLCCQNTPITELPPLPSSLTELDCSDCLNLLIQRNEGESIQDYNKRWENMREERKELESKQRCVERCLTVKEELMAAAWHPNRVEKWIEAYGIEVLD